MRILFARDERWAHAGESHGRDREALETSPSDPAGETPDLSSTEAMPMPVSGQSPAETAPIITETHEVEGTNPAVSASDTGLILGNLSVGLGELMFALTIATPLLLHGLRQQLRSGEFASDGTR